ncbi:hypothetical protein [Micromonospora sp. KLBMP9576]|uniref:hypothetical protein n=1 Tax=Micromonospora sp. KLBMP9576 TaxID=3424769 RepID=UPI003D93F552
MNVDGADRPEAGPDAGERPASGVDDRLRAVVLAVAGLVALAGGGWWWQAQAPVAGPVAGAPGVAPQAGATPAARVRAVVPEGAGRPTVFRVDPSSGAMFRADPSGGVTFRLDGDVPEPRRALEGLLDERARGGGLDSRPGTVWTVRAALGPAQGLVRDASAVPGADYLLQYRCRGPGELRIVIVGARAAGPLTSACDGSVTSVGIVGRGGPLKVSLSSANAEPLRVEAQLVAAH